MWGQGQQAQLTSLKPLVTVKTFGLGAGGGEAQHCSGQPCLLSLSGGISGLKSHLRGLSEMRTHQGIN